jgi:hypothetical protein
MRCHPVLAFLTLLVSLILISPAGVMAAEVAQPADGPAPPPPRILEGPRAPNTTRLVRQGALTYAPGMSAREREIDFLQKVSKTKNVLGVSRLVALRHETLNLLGPGYDVTWEDLRRRRWPGGEPVGVTLEAPVWVPARAQRLKTYSGFEKKWQTVALATPRPSGSVWFARTLADINRKADYRPATIQMEVNSKFAPLAALLLEYIFREGWYEPEKRLPLLVARMGEDTYAVSAASGPVAAECLTFPDSDGASMAATVALCSYSSMADIYHGRHAPASNHRLGLAMDLNDFNYAGVVDGPPNPISRSLRQYNRDAMHKLDARQLPSWVYKAASWMGCRIPQSWAYYGYNVDWPHIDVGTK